MMQMQFVEIPDFLLANEQEEISANDAASSTCRNRDEESATIATGVVMVEAIVAADSSTTTTATTLTTAKTVDAWTLVQLPSPAPSDDKQVSNTNNNPLQTAYVIFTLMFTMVPAVTLGLRLWSFLAAAMFVFGSVLGSSLMLRDYRKCSSFSNVMHVVVAVVVAKEEPQKKTPGLKAKVVPADAAIGNGICNEQGAMLYYCTAPEELKKSFVENLACRCSCEYCAVFGAIWVLGFFYFPVPGEILFVIPGLFVGFTDSWIFLLLYCCFTKRKVQMVINEKLILQELFVDELQE